MVRPIADSVAVSFGYRRLYSNGKPHKGVDFSDGKEGHTVMSCLPGVVTHAGYGGWGPAYGQHVIIRSTFGGKTVWGIYAHLKTEVVSLGQKISAGQKIGTSGGKPGEKYSGNSTGAHVHVQFCDENVYTAYIDPWPMINWRAAPAHPPTPVTAERVIYEVTADPSLIGREWPVNGPQGRDKDGNPISAKKGATVTGIGYTAKQSDGDVWIKNVSNLFWARRFLKVKEAPPQPTTSKPHSYISCNLAGNDTVGKGKRTRVARSQRDIPNYLAPKKPTWFHFQESYDDMLAGLDAGFSTHRRVPEGGRGRESYYRKDAGITILEAKLQNTRHPSPSDSTKEHLVIAWRDADGFEGVYVNFHNAPPSEGTKYQKPQLLDAIADGTAMCDKHGIDRKNLAVSGDSNLLGAPAYLRSVGWRESIDITKKAIDLVYRTLCGWAGALVKGDRIDIDVFAPGALVDEAEVLYGAVISDHWARRVIHRLIK